MNENTVDTLGKWAYICLVLYVGHRFSVSWAVCPKLQGVYIFSLFIRCKVVKRMGVCGAGPAQRGVTSAHMPTEKTVRES
jgi:hypothetical protein